MGCFALDFAALFWIHSVDDHSGPLPGHETVIDRPDTQGIDPIIRSQQSLQKQCNFLDKVVTNAALTK